MKKKLYSNICLCCLVIITLCACGKEASVVKTYEVNDSNTAFEDDELVTMIKHYEMSDGTWKTDTHIYQYRLEITGRMGGAEKESTFVFLSNIKDITFE